LRSYPNTPPGTTAGGWLLALVDVVLMTGLVASVKAVKLYWENYPKLKQGNKDLKTTLDLMLNRIRNYLEQAMTALNREEVTVFSNLLEIKNNVEEKVEEHTAEAESAAKLTLAMAESAVNGVMSRLRNSIDSEMQELRKKGLDGIKKVVQKVQDAEKEVVNHINDLIAKVEDEVAQEIETVMNYANGVLQDINDELDKMVKKVPCMFRDCARSAADSTKAKLAFRVSAAENQAQEKIDDVEGEVEGAVSKGDAMAKQKINDVGKQVNNKFKELYKYEK